MGLRKIYCCQPRVRVIEPNGRQRHFSPSITISELLHLYPRYCVCHVSGSILSADNELEGGNTYLLLPPPRLFPSATFTYSSHFLHLQKENEEEIAIGRGGTFIWNPRGRKRVRRDSNPRRISRVPAQEWHHKQNRGNRTVRRVTSWQPSLDMICENNALLKTKDERPVKEKEKKKAKPSNFLFNHGSWNGRVSNIELLVPPPGIIF